MGDDTHKMLREAVRFAYLAACEGIVIDGCEPETFLFNYSCASGDEDWETLHERVPDTAALRAEVEQLRANAEELLDAAEGVVQRWDSPDWKSGHTLDFITRLRHACVAVRQGG